MGTQLDRLERSREQIAKAWLVDVILNSPLGDAEQLPMTWITGELPELIGELLRAATENGGLEQRDLERAGRFAELRAGGVSASQPSRELGALHSTLLSTLRAELEGEPEAFAEAAQRLAGAFGELNAAIVESLLAGRDPTVDAGPGALDPLTGLPGPDQARRRLQEL